MKTTAEKIAVMQAYCDGEEIEYTQNNEDNWVDVPYPSWNWGSSKYRVKLQPQYQPFDFTDAKSLIGRIVKSKNNDYIGMITSVNKHSVIIGDVFIIHKTLLTDFLFLDDSICGKFK
jgi:hypothetical protein